MYLFTRLTIKNYEEKTFCFDAYIHKLPILYGV